MIVMTTNAIIIAVQGVGKGTGAGAAGTAGVVGPYDGEGNIHGPVQFTVTFAAASNKPSI